MANIMEAISQSSMNSKREQDSVLLSALQDRGTLSVEEVVTIFEDKGFNRPERSAKELVWEFVEKGKARFNDDWLLELT